MCKYPIAFDEVRDIVEDSGDDLDPPVGGHGSDMEELLAAYPGYFETQEEARCGRHALNNIVGAAVFTNSDLTEACEYFLDEYLATHGIRAPRHHHEKRQGWYSSEVLARTLTNHSMELLLEPLHRNPDRLFDEDILGAVVNQGNAHWVALKYVDHCVWLLDSLDGPQLLSNDEYLAFVLLYASAFPVRAL